MPRSQYRFIEEDTAPNFLTATTANWLPLFNDSEIARNILDSLRFLIRHRRLSLYAYVLMKNHLHLVASAENLSREIANFKSFTARKCIGHYTASHNQFILHQLAFHKLQHKRERPYQFWQEGTHPQRIKDREMMHQKIEYIHHNPVRRGYVDDPEHWRYSSARNYAGMVGLLEVTLEW